MKRWMLLSAFALAAAVVSAQERVPSAMQSMLDRELPELMEELPPARRLVRVPGIGLVPLYGDGRGLIHDRMSERPAALLPDYDYPRPALRAREPSSVRRVFGGRVGISSGNAAYWTVSEGTWSRAAIYPGSYLDARTISLPLPRR